MMPFRMTKVVRYILLIICLLIYIYNIQLQAIPIAAKTLLAVPGFIYFLTDKKSKVTYQKLQKYIKLFGIALLLFLWGLFTMAINGSDEMLYLAYIKNFLLWFFEAYFLCHLAKNIVSSFFDLCKIITIVVAFESLLALCLKFNPSFAEIVSNIVEMKVYQVSFDNYMDTSDLTDFSRIIGFGNAVYFGVLTSCTLGLISGAYVLYHSKSIFIYIVCYIIISIVSIMTARIAVVPVVLGLALVLFYHAKERNGHVIGTTILISLSAFVTIHLAQTFLPDNMLEWQMELFGNMTENSESERLQKWLINTTFEDKTLFIGDAHYKVDDFAYYKNVDIGFYRQIFYSGLIGLSIILYYNIMILKYIKESDISDKSLGPYVAVLFICYLISMFKGDINYVELYLLVLMMFDFSINLKSATIIQYTIKGRFMNR